MIFKHIDIQNFLSIGHMSLSLQDRGLILIQGQNNDNPSLNNNGAGKSSIIEAIVFALYGRTLRGLKGDSVINRAIGKNTRVCLTVIDDDNSEYQIIRQRKYTGVTAKYQLFRDGVNITPKSEGDFDQYIVQLLQADYSIFTASLLYSSESMKLSTSSDADIKKVFETILGLNVLMQAHINTKEKLRITLKNQLQIQSQIYKLSARLIDIDNTLQELEQSNTKFNEDQINRRMNLQQSLKDAQGKYSQSLSELKQWANKLEINQVHLDSLCDKFDDIQSQFTQLNDYKLQIATLKEKIADANIEMVKSQKSMESLQKELKRAEIFQSKLEQTIKQCQDKIDVAYSKIGQPCSLCGTPLTEQSMSSVITQYQSQLSEYQSQYTKSSEDIKELQDQVQSIQDQLTVQQKIVKSYKLKQLELEDIIESNTITQHKLELEQKIKSVENKVTECKSELKVKQVVVSQLEKSIQDINFRLEELATIKNPYEISIKKFIDEKSIATHDIDTNMRKLEQLKIEVQRLEFWEKGFSNQGIKSFILDDVTPYLNRRLNKYLSQLTSGQIEAQFSTQTTLKSGEQREKFSLNISGNNYQSNSAGEKKRIDLAISLALQDLVSTRATKKIDIALFDEIFDSLDENGIDKVVNLLHELAKEKSTIFVITHNEYLKSYFTNILTVIKQNGVSSLE